MKILYLYSEIMGYTMATVCALVEKGAEVEIVHWDHKKLTSYQHPQLTGVRFYKRSQHDYRSLWGIVQDINPDITVVSGWMDNTYLRVAFNLRQRNKFVVCCLDNHWKATFKQFVNCFLGKVGLFRLFFSHIWVAGNYQYEYATRLGFKRNAILRDLYSAEVSLFQREFLQRKGEKSKNYPYRFLYVGRIEPVKGVHLLLSAWQKFKGNRRYQKWELHLIGDGSLTPLFRDIRGVFTRPFCEPNEVAREMSEAGVFLLPSLQEPWGVVLHEAVAAGLPLVASDMVGAATAFLIPGSNGFSFEAGNEESLLEALTLIAENDHEGMVRMAGRSYDLSFRITPDTSAANLLSILHTS